MKISFINQYFLPILPVLILEVDDLYGVIRSFVLSILTKYNHHAFLTLFFGMDLRSEIPFIYITIPTLEFRFCRSFSHTERVPSFMMNAGRSIFTLSELIQRCQAPTPT